MGAPYIYDISHLRVKVSICHAYEESKQFCSPRKTFLKRDTLKNNLPTNTTPTVSSGGSLKLA